MHWLTSYGFSSIALQRRLDRRSPRDLTFRSIPGHCEVELSVHFNSSASLLTTLYRSLLMFTVITDS